MINKLNEWLEKQGYPLEMKVAKELLKSGFHPLQSNYYKDPESEKSREIDVIGQIGYTYKEYNIIFQLIIECKNNISKPWITFSSETHGIGNREFLTHRPSSRIGNKYLQFLSENNLASEMEIFKRPQTFAYNVTQAFETDSDRVYSALMSVSNATKYRKEKINNDTKFAKHCEIYFPMIVLGGKLFDCYLDESNQSQIEEIGHKTLLWKNSTIGNVNTLVEIITFDSFKDRLSLINEQLIDLLTKKSNKFFEDTHSNFTMGFL